MASTTPRSIRVSDEDWEEMQRLADEAGLSRSTYVRRAALGRLERVDTAPVRHDLRTLVIELRDLAEALPEGEEDHRPLLRSVLRRAWRVLDQLTAARRRA